MTQLQNEIIKLLDESKLEKNQEQLDEASFEDIAKAAGEINPEAIKNGISQPSVKFAEHCKQAAEAIDSALKALKSADSVYKFNKNSVFPANAKDTMLKKMKRKFNDMKDRSDSKENVLNALKSASRMMAQAQDDVTQARMIYNKLNKELKKLYNSVEAVQKMVDSKTSWFGRTFKFWK